MFGEQYQRLSFFSEWKGSTAGGKGTANEMKNKNKGKRNSFEAE